jgi:hypothetical protein
MTDHKRCRHYQSWILGDVWEWCYQCGALRRHTITGTNAMSPVTQWTRPTGADGQNPYPMRELKGEADDR